MRSIVAKESVLEVTASGRVHQMVASSPYEAQQWKYALQNMQVDVEWDLASGATEQRTQSSLVLLVPNTTSILPPEGRNRACSGDV